MRDIMVGIVSRERFRTRVVCLLAAAALIAGCGGDDAEREESPAEGETIPDLSGLAWLGGDRFLAVHDAKNPDELDSPRLSILTLPDSLGGIEAEVVDVEWPDPQGPSSDLESADRVPGTDRVIFAESGDDGGDFQRIFLAEYSDGEVEIVDHIDWPRPVYNVEGLAVGRVGDELVFLYAERAQGEPSTEIRWAPLHLDPLRVGSFSRVTFSNPEPVGPDSRPVSALTADSEGTLYASSAIDPDRDGGPFTSAVWSIGELIEGEDGPDVELATEPELLGRADGFKVESVSVREHGDRAVVFAGTDDEYYGGTMRPLPSSP
jgi:hypothetical protein